MPTTAAKKKMAFCGLKKEGVAQSVVVWPCPEIRITSWHVHVYWPSLSNRSAYSIYGCTLFITRVPKCGKCVWNWDTEALVLDPSHYYREGLLHLATADSLELMGYIFTGTILVHRVASSEERNEAGPKLLCT